uniref:Radial spoke head protein 9 homolog n=1 Tax=Timema monikensis TaxID=170555 RepID=A0A7R9E1A9_9NEOP|nr:unnamed protein product [Timema monikensis]
MEGSRTVIPASNKNTELRGPVSEIVRQRLEPPTPNNGGAGSSGLRIHSSHQGIGFQRDLPLFKLTNIKRKRSHSFCRKQIGQQNRRYLLNNEQCVILKNALLILQNENHLKKIFFWGQILGLDNDYFIAYGYEHDALNGLIYYYSTNCIKWGLMPTVTEKARHLTKMCSTRFQGDPTLQIDVSLDVQLKQDTVEDKVDQQTEQVKQEDSGNMLKEEDRLAATVEAISIDTAVVPRGALFKRPDGSVVENLTFAGLTALEGRQLKSYLHLRKPQEKWVTNLLTRLNYNYALDFLDSVDKDIPEGCWSLQSEMSGLLALLRSSTWPGMTFYHRLLTPEHGYLYIGNGRKNVDLLFMICLPHRHELFCSSSPYLYFVRSSLDLRHGRTNQISKPTIKNRYKFHLSDQRIAFTWVWLVSGTPLSSKNTPTSPDQGEIPCPYESSNTNNDKAYLHRSCVVCFTLIPDEFR